MSRLESFGFLIKKRGRSPGEGVLGPSVSEGSRVSPGDSVPEVELNQENSPPEDAPVRKRKAICSSSSAGPIKKARLKYSENPTAAQSLLARLPFEQRGWCQHVTMAPSKSGGYIQVSAGGANKFSTLEEVVVWAKGEFLGEGEQCSHDCHLPSCKNPSHIAPRSILDNQNRKGCRVWVDCPHAGEGCSKKIDVCSHRPRCIRFCEGFEDHLHFWREGLHLNDL